jgi:thiamine-monophosphate kinase
MRSQAPRHRHPIRLGPGGEFDLIRSFLGPAAPSSDFVLVGPGDDCVIVDAAPTALSTDLSVEDVHFRRAWLEPEQIGWRAAASALSDLAAVAAEPVAVLVSVALRVEDVDSGWGTRLMSGAREAAEAVGAALVGGDVSRAPGPVVVDVVAVGRARKPVLRDGALAGDEVWVSGALGAAGAAVALLEAGRPLPAVLRAPFERPVPRTREALWLSERADLHAMIDLSDGIAGDAAHVAAASGLAIELDIADLPVAPGVEVAAPESDDRLRLALSAGEDYELCVAAGAGVLAPLAAEFQGRFGVALTRVGRARAGEGVWSRDEAGRTRKLERGGFSHFAAAKP